MESYFKFLLKKKKKKREGLDPHAIKKISSAEPSLQKWGQMNRAH